MKKIQITSTEALKKYKEQNWKFYTKSENELLIPELKFLFDLGFEYRCLGEEYFELYDKNSRLASRINIRDNKKSVVGSSSFGLNVDVYGSKRDWERRDYVSANELVQIIKRGIEKNKDLFEKIKKHYDLIDPFKIRGLTLDEKFSLILEKSLELPTTKSLKEFFEKNGNFYFYDDYQDIKQSPLSSYSGGVILSKEKENKKNVICRTLYEWNSSISGEKLIHVGYYQTNDGKLTKAYSLEIDSTFKNLEDFIIHTLIPKTTKKLTKPVSIFAGSEIDSLTLVTKLLPSILFFYKEQYLPESLRETLERFKQNGKANILEEIIKNL